MSIISDSLKRIKPSPTIVVTQKARELKAAGKDVIGLGAGEPDFDTPGNIKEAAIKAINDGDTKYTAVDGTPALKKAIVDKFKRENNLDYTTEQITVGTGGKQVLYNAFMATLNKGDEVIIPAPYWVSYPDMVLLSGGKPKIVKCDEKDGFKLTAKKLKKAITKKTKWLILNSPSNPSGAMYSDLELMNIVKILSKHPHVWILSDDLYEHITFDNLKFNNILQVEPSFKSRTLIVNGVSKAYAMTGWRLGYAGGPKELIDQISKIQSQSTTHTSSISQIAAIEALNNSQEFIKQNKLIFQERRDMVYSSLKKCNKLDLFLPQGSFYIYVCCDKLINKKKNDGTIIKNDIDFSSYLLDEAGVAVVPGEAFGTSNYFRISFATSKSNLEEGCSKIIEACNKLK